MGNINWGIIGCGNVCEKKSGPAFYKIEHSNLVAVMRRDEAKAKDFATRHNVPQYYNSVTALLEDPDVNAVYVATPPNTHKEYAILAMKVGKPVYVEKPMAINYDDCLEMIDASQKYNQKIFIAYYRRKLPYFLKVKELLDKKQIGEPLIVNTKLFRAPHDSDFDANNQTWRVQKNIAGEGYFFDLAPHTLDILDFLLGDIEEAKGFSANLAKLYDVKDTISTTLRFRSGILATALWCFVTAKDSEEDVIEIVGTRGKIVFSTFTFSPIQLISDNLVQAYDIPSPEHIQQPLIQSIVDELRGIGTCPSTGITGSRTSLIMDQILASNI